MSLYVTSRLSCNWCNQPLLMIWSQSGSGQTILTIEWNFNILVDLKDPEMSNIFPTHYSCVSLFQIQWQQLMQSFRTSGFCVCKWMHSKQCTDLEHLMGNKGKNVKTIFRDILLDSNLSEASVASNLLLCCLQLLISPTEPPDIQHWGLRCRGQGLLLLVLRGQVR